MGLERADEPPHDEGNIFDGVVYYLSASLKSDIAESIRAVMSANRGQEVTRRDAHQATHIISVSHGLEKTDLDVSIPFNPGQAIVTPHWVLQAVWSEKLLEYFSTDPRMIFSGVVGCSADIPPGDREVIAAGVQSLGGQWRYGLTREVTHLFTLTPTGEKYDTAMHYYNLVKRPYIVTPHWFDDSVKCRRRQNVDQYLFPDPDVLRSGFSIESLDISPELRDETDLEDRFRQISHPEVLQGRRRSAGTRREAADNRFNAWKSFAQASVQDGELPPQNDNIWDGRRLLLSPLLKMGRGRRQAVESELKKAGAKIVKPQAPDEDSFDVLIVPHADGPHYKMAEANGGKLVGTLAWLFHIQGTGCVTNPQDHLLHIPRPVGGIPGFQGKKISLTNYAGHSREFLKELIIRIGAEFSGELKQKESNILVAAMTTGKKVEKAMQWTIPVVNHTWLEDCFRNWKYIEPSAKMGAYTTFPPGVDWSDSLDLRAPQDGERFGNPVSSPAVSSPPKQPNLEASSTSPLNSLVHNKTNTNTNISIASKPVESMELDQVIQPPSAERDGSVLEVERAMADLEPPRSPITSPNAPPVLEISDSEAPAPVSVKVVPQRQPSHDTANMELDNSPTSSTRVNNHVGETESPPLLDQEEVTVHQNSNLYPRRSNALVTHHQVIPLESDDESDQVPDADELIQRSYAKSQARLKCASPLVQPTPKASGKSVGRAKGKQRADDSELHTPEDSKVSNLTSSKQRRSGLGGIDTGVHVATTDAAGPSRQYPRIRGPDFGSPTWRSDAENPKPPRPTKEEEEKVYRETAEAIRQKASGQAPKRPSLPTNPTLNRLPPEEKARLQKEREEAAKLKSTKVRRKSHPKSPMESTNLLQANRLGSTAAPPRRAAAVKADRGLSTQMEDANSHAASLKSSKGDLRKLSLGKRTRDEYMDDGGEVVEVENDVMENRVRKTETKGSAKAKMENPKRESSERTARVLLTMCNIGTPEKILKKLGVVITEDPDKCTHLVSNGICRTPKFVRAMCVAKFALKPSWLEDSVKASRLLAEEPYWILDKEKENRFKFRLKEVLAKDRSTPVLRDITIYATEHIGMDTDTLKHVVISAGGQFVKSTSPLAKTLRKPNCYLISSLEDKNVWGNLTNTDGTPMPVYNFQFIVNSVLRQELDLEGEADPVLLNDA